MIVMASHGRRGVAAVVLGSETVKVLTHSKISLLEVDGFELSRSPDRQDGFRSLQTTEAIAKRGRPRRPAALNLTLSV